MKAYAPAGHGSNDPQRYAQQVADAPGVSTDTSPAALYDDQFTVFADAIRRVEGWRSGEAHGPDDLPDDVAQWLADHPSRPERTAADQPFAHQGVIAEGVKNIQQRPNEPGWTPPLGVDGDFGPRTKEAVPWFQSGSGLTADGIVGNKTWRQLVGAR
ncbi:peptidoglycan-binding domain-containing protein [Streptomyces sp. NPDC005727]|uniref:peptidoglycan-binding domain-containing protein n=1 Tax=Streptomyces sp. NPDC005727 TaxID=3157053 RepID=UPI0033CB516A